MTNASTMVGARVGLGCKGLSLRNQSSDVRTGLQEGKAMMGWRRLFREGGLEFGPLLDSQHSPANPTVGGGVQMLVMTSLLRARGLLLRTAKRKP